MTLSFCLSLVNGGSGKNAHNYCCILLQLFEAFVCFISPALEVTCFMSSYSWAFYVYLYIGQLQEIKHGLLFSLNEIVVLSMHAKIRNVRETASISIKGVLHYVRE